MIAAALLLAAPVVAPPPGLQFAFFRMAAFRQRVTESNCPADFATLEALRKRLAARYGKAAFAWPKVPAGSPGDCRAIESVFRVNLTDFRRDAEAALASPVEAGTKE